MKTTFMIPVNKNLSHSLKIMAIVIIFHYKLSLDSQEDDHFQHEFELISPQSTAKYTNQSPQKLSIANVGKITQKDSQISHFDGIKSKIERRKNQSKNLCKSHIADGTQNFSYNVDQNGLRMVEDKLRQSTETFRRSFSQVNIDLNNENGEDNNRYIKVSAIIVIVNFYSIYGRIINR